MSALRQKRTLRATDSAAALPQVKALTRLILLRTLNIGIPIQSLTDAHMFGHLVSMHREVQPSLGFGTWLKQFLMLFHRRH
jgi:hypothetical protein